MYCVCEALVDDDEGVAVIFPSEVLESYLNDFAAGCVYCVWRVERPLV